MYNNHISALSAVEMARRIVLHREIPENLRVPGLLWDDVQTILYGAETSTLFPGLLWGGMAADTAIFVQTALNMTAVEEAARGEWRIFSKLGAGWSTSRLVGEIITTAYACLPYSSDSPSSDDTSWEFTLSGTNAVLTQYLLSTSSVITQY